ncbi:MAG: FAD-dependent oxidoreductase [Planctomycetes bacterium]|nr:FAD-dependent oxidoreductase [Planctomycetota bacterium]
MGHVGMHDAFQRLRDDVDRSRFARHARSPDRHERRLRRRQRRLGCLAGLRDVLPADIAEPELVVAQAHRLIDPSRSGFGPSAKAFSSFHRRPDMRFVSIATLILAASFSACFADQPAASKLVANLEAGRPRHLVVYGTSLTAAGPWVEQLRLAMQRRYGDRIQITNSGGSGQNSRWGVANLDAKVIDLKPDAVFMEFSMNDAAVKFNLSVDEAKKNYQTMLDRIAAALPECEVFLEVMNPCVGYGKDSTHYRADLPGYYQMVRDLAAARHLKLIDHGPTWDHVLAKGEAFYKTYVHDGVHPDAAGCALYVTPTILADLGVRSDVVIYGGTSAAMTAAVQVRNMGKTVMVVSPDTHLGGLTSSGLGFTDTGNKSVIGGLSRQFYHRIWEHYDQDASWVWQKKAEYGNKGQGTEAIDSNQRTMWIFEPHAAEEVYDNWMVELQIPVVRDAWLDRSGKGVAKDGQRITSITTLDGRTFRGAQFIDATYEGDLMAAAGVTYTVGRESTEQYGEKWNGIQVGVLHHGHHFAKPVDPYVKPGDPASGLLPRISADPPGEYGAADKRVQAYCFRMCLTNVDENRIPFPKPDGYDAGQYELLLRVYDTGWRETFGKFDPIPNHKTDTNNHGPFSTDNIGYNYDYPEASYERRREIVREHETYQKGLMYFIANDPRVPEETRKKMATYGLPKDEFMDNGGWPHQIYVREARRMVGMYVMTENELLKRRPTPDSIGMGSYTMDSHNVERYVKPDGFVQNEGDIGVSTNGPYEIAYGTIVPKAGECENLLVPVAVSSSHIAYGSIRMEPVFMILGQSAATAACMSLDEGIPVQKLAYAKLREQLVDDGQVLDGSDARNAAGGVDVKQLKGIVIDDAQAKLTGHWTASSAVGPFVANGYRHDGAAGKGMSAVFETKLPEAGKYEVRFSYTDNANRSAAVPVTIHHAGGNTVVKVDERTAPPIDKLWVSLGVFEFAAGEPATVSISNEGLDGYVVIDGVQFIPAK